MTRWSVRLRATVLATLVVALALGITAGVFVWVLRGSLEAAAAADATRKADEAVCALTTTVQSSGQAETGRVGCSDLPPGVPALESPSATRRTGGAQSPGPDLPGLSAGDPDVLIGGAPAPTGWGANYSVENRTVNTAAGGQLVISTRSSLEPVTTALAALRPVLIVGVPALLALVAGVTWLMLGRALAPVTAIRTRFTEITASDLHQRVPVPAARDEVARLAVAMNATLDRLQAAVQQHRRFVADAAHELRSPLATLRTRLELGRRRRPAALLDDALVDVVRIQTLAADLLLIARLDAGEPLRREPVDLGQIAVEAAGEAEVRTQRRDVRLDLRVEPDVVVDGSAGHLRRLVGNLVDNALRHAASTVTVRVSPGAVLEVTDDGPGIPVEERERVFDRFTRLDEARARDAGGSGLGLAIARDVARAHGGRLAVTGTGSTLRADLPPVAGDPSSPGPLASRTRCRPDGSDAHRQARAAAG